MMFHTFKLTTVSIVMGLAWRTLADRKIASFIKLCLACQYKLWKDKLHIYLKFKNSNTWKTSGASDCRHWRTSEQVGAAQNTKWSGQERARDLPTSPNPHVAQHSPAVLTSYTTVQENSTHASHLSDLHIKYSQEQPNSAHPGVVDPFYQEITFLVTFLGSSLPSTHLRPAVSSGDRAHTRRPTSTSWCSLSLTHTHK